ncbi:hypothetical protein, partial [Lysinibacillus sp. D4B2_S17]|uniref:hypothetical protein n=1 Tax=Lysinibacillus sp. D4B2_S17 TaxID=2941225 RepID=UPI0020C0E553
GLEAETEYQLYVVMKDNSGNYSVDPAIAKEFKTGELDNIPPYVVGGELVLHDEMENEFYITDVSKLDPIS